MFPIRKEKNRKKKAGYQAFLKAFEAPPVFSANIWINKRYFSVFKTCLINSW